MKKTLLLLIVVFHTFISHAQCWQSVSAGGAHTLGIRTGGGLFAWGRNNSNQLGNNSTTNSNTPIQIGTALDWTMVSAGNGHSVALKSNGTLWTWGRNLTGQLGNNTTTNLTVPTQIGTDTDWVLISAGDEYTLALKSNGTLWGWGDNTYGQLGNGTSGAGNMLLVPTQIGAATWRNIAAGTSHTLGIKLDGSLWAWGRNNSGQLGNNTTIDLNTPTQITATTDWLDVMAGNLHSVGKKTDGSLWTWGDNTNGQLGDGTSGALNSKSYPINIGTMSVTSLIAKGYQHTIIRKNDGKLYSWGGNTSGQLGNGNNSQQNNPGLVNNDTDWFSVSSKSSHTVALKSDGTLWAWGANVYGQLGDGTGSAKNTPTLITCPTLGTESFDMASNGLRVYPNPATSVFYITLDNTTIDGIRLTDLSGKLILEKKGNIFELSVENLEDGIYFVEVATGSRKLVTKLIKSK